MCIAVVETLLLWRGISEPLRKTDSVELDPIKEDKEDIGGDTNHTGAEAKPDQDDRDVESGDVVIDHTQVGEDGQLMRYVNV